MEFKRGTVISCEYLPYLEGNSEQINQVATIVTEDGMTYDLSWVILGNASNQELLGDGDKVSILIENEQIRNLRIR